MVLILINQLVLLVLTMVSRGRIFLEEKRGRLVLKFDLLKKYIQ